MSIFQVPLLIFFSVAFAFGSGGLDQDSLTADVSLDVIAAIDDAYFHSSTMTGRETTYAEPFRPADPGGVFEWRFTQRGDDIALHRKLVEPHPIVFLPRGHFTHLHYDGEGNLVMSVLIEEMFRISADDRFHLVKYDICTVSPDGVVVKREPQDRVDYYAPDDHFADLPLYRMMWSAGRGFSPHLEQILESKERKDGLVELKVAGFMALPTRGVWDLLVDPSRSYLVTKAAFTREGRTEPTIAIDNQHLITSGACEMAATSSWSVDLDVKWASQSERQTCGFTVDEQLLNHCEKAKQGPFPNYSLGIDNRTGEPVVIDLDPPQAFQATQVESRFIEMLALFFTHLLVGGYFYFLYWRRTASGESTSKGHFA